LPFEDLADARFGEPSVVERDSAVSLVELLTVFGKPAGLLIGTIFGIAAAVFTSTIGVELVALVPIIDTINPLRPFAIVATGALLGFLAHFTGDVITVGQGYCDILRAIKTVTLARYAFTATALSDQQSASHERISYIF